jgi:5-methylcytosine-specific restriction protein B
MAKMNHPELNKWYDIAARWVDAAFVKGDSLFTPGKAVWTLNGLNDLYHRFVENYDAGEGDFLGKLNGQIADAPPETRQLMAELLYVYYLPMAGNVKPETKRKTVEAVLSGIAPPVIG